MADGSWYLALVGKRSQLGAWDCVACRKCGFKANFAWRDTCRSCGRNRPSAGVRLQRAARSLGRSWTLSKCDAAVWEAAKGALTASEQSEIEEKRRDAVDQPTAHSARKQLQQEVAPLSKLESAYQRQHFAVVDACVLLAETGGRVKEQKTRVQQESVEAALETSREAGGHHAGCGEDVARFCRFWP